MRILFSDWVRGITDAEETWLQEYISKQGPLSFRWAFRSLDNYGSSVRCFWFHSQESADLSELASLLVDFLAENRPHEILTVTFAETEDLPLIGQFSGGALVISADGVETFDATFWAQSRREALEKVARP